MLSKSKLLLSIVCLSMMTIAYGQAPVTATTVKGTPYLDEKYVDGVIHFSKKTLAAPMRYNAFKDLMEYQQNGQVLVFDPSESITKVQCGNTTFVTAKHEAKRGYYAILDSGKVSFLVKKKIYILPGRKGGNIDGSDEAAQYKPSPDEYFFRIGDGPLQEVGNVKSMIAAFPDKQEELTQFAKKEKISPRKGSEIRKLVQYYNSL